MRPSSTRSPHRSDARGTRRFKRFDARWLAPLLGLLCMGCLVSSSTYESVLAERDGLLTERARLRDRVRGLETQTRRLESSNESLSNERIELLDAVEGLRTERQDLETDVSGLNRDVKGLERNKAELGSELARREGQLKEREALLEERSTELATLSAQLEARNAELTARLNDLRDRDTEIERLQQSYQAFVADLESEIAGGEIVIDQLREGILVNLPDATFFASESVELTLHGKVTLAKVAAQLRPMSHQVVVQGHTDDMPPPEALGYPTNWEVAGARASAVVRQLVAHGIVAERIRAVSYGSARPVAPNDTEEDRARNRRIEIRLIPKTGTPARPLSAALPYSPGP
ncbi:MAG: OmpA family protein [Deltaproteobacteria bacterium]|nr:OmpA family protein [Deltaproteobacteria bacterium]MBW2446034.1 OmpA family protein [Deltaproteobacteria bacterium]